MFDQSSVPTGLIKVLISKEKKYSTQSQLSPFRDGNTVTLRFIDKLVPLGTESFIRNKFRLVFVKKMNFSQTLLT